MSGYKKKKRFGFVPAFYDLAIEPFGHFGVMGHKVFYKPKIV